LKLQLLLILHAIKNKVENKLRKIRVAEGFTLAEVLITLLIIGIVASIVIPALIHDTQDAELKIAWKKGYAEVSQAMSRVFYDNSYNLVSLNIPASSQYSNIKDYFNYTKAYSNMSPCCQPLKNVYPGFTTIKRLNGTDESYCLFDDGILILNSGIILIFNNVPETTIWVDVNGLKGPGVIGKDVFGIKVYKNMIKPFGSAGDGYENTCTPTSTGWGCAARYLTQ